jgi:outer membrane protein OmpA-like peptidoglycan-associated protein
VFFEYKSAEILPPAHAALTTLGRALADTRLADRAFLIAGHTDAKGGVEYNLKLSQERADAVRQFLIDNFGIDPRKLTAKGFGKRRLKNPDEPLAGENRRVQIVSYSTRDVR